MIWIMRFLSISRSQWPWMIAGIILGVAVILANTLLMAISGWFIASMAVSGSSGAAFNYFFPSASIRFLAVARTVGRYAERLVTHEATFRILAELRVWLFKRLEPLAPACLEKYAGGDVTGRLRADVDALETLHLKIIAPLAIGSISIVAALCYILWFSVSSALVMLLFLLFSGVMLPLLARRLSEKPGRRVAVLSAELRSKVSEGVQGVEELIIFGAVDRQASTVNLLSAEVVSEQVKLGRINGLSAGLMALSAGFAVVAVLIVCTSQIVTLHMPAPNLVMLLLFSAAIFESVGLMPVAFNMLPTARESAARIFELADAPIPVPECAVPVDPPLSNGICFTNVCASYSEDSPVLNNFSMNLPAGCCAVITGRSGTGKSLLMEILLRFRCYEGSVTVGGVEISDIRKSQLMDMIAAVPQRPYLFNGTIRENIMLGNMNADDSDLQVALKDAALDGWISRLPQGLDTFVGINGSAVSGGEARRIALARALLKNAPILLLDEPTEGLDISTELDIVSRLNDRFRGSGGTTLLIVSHRPACLSLSDMVIRL